MKLLTTILFAAQLVSTTGFVPPQPTGIAHVGRTTHPRQDPCSTMALHMDIVGVSPEPIHTAFALATFGPQPFWLLMILQPKNEITKKVMGSMGECLLTSTSRYFSLCVVAKLTQTTYVFLLALAGLQMSSSSLHYCTFLSWELPSLSPIVRRLSWNLMTSLTPARILKLPL